MSNPTPIRDCAWQDREDGTCSNPNNMTPECHIWICPQLAPWIEKAVEVCRDAYILAEDRTDTAPEPCNDTYMLSLMIEAKAVLDKAEGAQ